MKCKKQMKEAHINAEDLKVVKLYTTFMTTWRFKPKIAADLLLLHCRDDLYSIFVAITANKQIREAE